MTKHIVLDSSPLGLLSNPNATAALLAISQWSRDCIVAGHKLYIPEVIDYELRRELPRAKKIKGIAKLDNLKAAFNYLPLTTASMLRAADLWANARQHGISTGDPKKLDIDVILAAQALTLSVPQGDIIIATSNVSHLSRFVSADTWMNITP